MLTSITTRFSTARMLLTKTTYYCSSKWEASLGVLTKSSSLYCQKPNTMAGNSPNLPISNRKTLRTKKKHSPNRSVAYATMKSIKESISLFLSANICIIVSVSRIGWQNKRTVQFARKRLFWMSFTSRKTHSTKKL